MIFSLLFITIFLGSRSMISLTVSSASMSSARATVGSVSSSSSSSRSSRPPGASSKAVRRCWPLVSRFFLLS